MQGGSSIAARHGGRLVRPLQPAGTALQPARDGAKGDLVRALAALLVADARKPETDMSPGVSPNGRASSGGRAVVGRLHPKLKP
jgi:hypothetical protein